VFTFDCTVYIFQALKTLEHHRTLRLSYRRLPTFRHQRFKEGSEQNVMEEIGLDPNYRLAMSNDMAKEMLSLFSMRETNNP
jgi:hypothetical protein